ncbi:MAG: HPF/RaiA family ribosome-associated protein [Spirochaetales bacterium]|nr:HPF/RaiA family ribosome-associated protein [Spirochaetales bacterium]
MKVPLQLSFRNIGETREMEELVRKQAVKLDKYHNHITSCRVAVEMDQKHGMTANPYRVRIDITIPPGHEIAVVEKPKKGDSRVDPATMIRRAFKAARKQVHSTKLKQRGEVKTHPYNRVQGIVTVLYPDKGYGFIKNLEGQDIYFHRNSVVHNEFGRLSIGTGVRFSSELGEDGLQATSVHIEDKPGIHGGGRGGGHRYVD